MSVQPIIATLKQLEQCYEQMMEQGHRKTQIIIRNEINELMKIMIAEKGIMRKIQEAEDVLSEQSQAFIRSKGIKSQLKLTISELLKLVFNAEEKLALKEAQQSLNDLLHQMKQLNDHNQQLLEQSLQFANYQLDLMVEHPEDNAFYKRPDHARNAYYPAGKLDTRG
ncbi:flagellar protein FlgN [Paenibacillus sp. 1001270B_150601_E10]|uniref:flagellar protein FlgN n=1 Tax=Paenibacillus sp. 1001270B_150601_E10 TaxID=2787079 RepID=UPI00189F6E01|nr:flagellar protein FlgN [Paenibacillus sp. 1001270B_150601_E10]